MGEGGLNSSYIANVHCLQRFLVLYCHHVEQFYSVTIHAIRKTSSLPKTLRTLLLSLAVSDLGVGLLVQPLHIARLVCCNKTLKTTQHFSPRMYVLRQCSRMFQDVKNHPTFYTVYTSTVLCFSYATFFGVILLSLDRFLAIHLHLRYQELVTHKRVLAAVISSGVFSAFFPLVGLWVPAFVYAVINGGCFLTALILSWKVHVAVRRHTNQIRALQVQQIKQANAGMANSRRLTKSAFTAIFVYIVFVVCYLPNICITWFRIHEKSLVLTKIRFYTLTVLLLNSSLNPIIYC